MLNDTPLSLDAARERRRRKPGPPEPEPTAGVLTGADLRRSLAGVMEDLVEGTIALDRLGDVPNREAVLEQLEKALVASGRAAVLLRGTGTPTGALSLRGSG